jgi:hypothetical protein
MEVQISPSCTKVQGGSFRRAGRSNDEVLFLYFLLDQGIVYRDIPAESLQKKIMRGVCRAWMTYPSGSLECANFSVMYQGTGYFSDGNSSAGGRVFFLNHLRNRRTNQAMRASLTRSFSGNGYPLIMVMPDLHCNGDTHAPGRCPGARPVIRFQCQHAQGQTRPCYSRSLALCFTMACAEKSSPSRREKDYCQTRPMGCAFVGGGKGGRMRLIPRTCLQSFVEKNT